MLGFSRKSSLRFSLRRMLVVMAVVLLALSHGQSSYRLDLAEQEITRLRTDAGYLAIDDPGKVHVVALASPVAEPRTHRWRIYVSPGASYFLKMCVNELPDEGIPKDAPGATLEPGEWTVELRTTKRTYNSWIVIYEARSASGTVGDSVTLVDAHADWLEENWRTGMRKAGLRGTDVFDVGEEVRLLALRAEKDRWPDGAVQPTNPPSGRGVLLVLTPE